jgi:hypothetical protein
MDRPALAKLLEDVRARKIDVIVVYKVDRLTRSLADFAKVVELFDEHDVSFISVTQAFNTTTSMGRLRHKGRFTTACTARSSTLRRGIASNAGLRSKRKRGRPPTAMPNPFSRGSFTMTEATEWGQAMPPKAGGVGVTTFRKRSSRAASPTPDPSRASLRPKSRSRCSTRSKASSHPNVRTRVLALCRFLVFPGGRSNSTGKPCQAPSSQEDVLDAIERVTIGAKQIEIRLSESVAISGQDRTLTIPWIPPSPYQRREIIQGKGGPRSPIRPMRVRARAVFAESLRNAHRWLDDLVMDPNQTIALITAREGKSERSIRMTLSLAFIAPPIVVAAIEGRLPRGFGAKRLMDLPMVWSHQWTALGLKVSA